MEISLDKLQKFIVQLTASFVILLCFVQFSFGQTKKNQSKGKSKLFTFLSKSENFDVLLKKSAVGEVDGILGYSHIEQKGVKGCFVNQFVLENEISKIEFSGNYLDLFPHLSTNLVATIKKHGISVKERSKWRKYFDLEYTAPGIVGFISGRGGFVNDKDFELTFFVYETNCKTKN